MDTSSAWTYDYTVNGLPGRVHKHGLHEMPPATVTALAEAVDVAAADDGSVAVSTPDAVIVEVRLTANLEWNGDEVPSGAPH